MLGPDTRPRGLRGTARTAALALAAAAALLAARPAPVPAQTPDDWVLESFYVVRHREDVEVSRETIPGAATRDFEWYGREEHGQAYPFGSIIQDAELHLTLPDRLRPGQPFDVAARVAGTVDTPGRSPDATGYRAYMVLDVKCYDTRLCYFGDSEFKELVPREQVSLAIDLPAQKVTMPTEPDRHPVSSVVYVHAGIGSTLPNDDYWTIDVSAYYRRPETPSGYSLELDADARQVPPSGRVPSRVAVTATVRDPGGRPVQGDALAFRLDPPDLGSLSAASGTTDASGEVRVVYQAPDVAVLGDRSEVRIVASDGARSLERGLVLGIARYALQLSVEPDALTPAEPPPTARVRATVRDFEGRPVAGEIIAFALDPPGLGALAPPEISTNAQGVAETVYTPPRASALGSRDRVTIRAANRTHGGEEGVEVRFLGMRAVAADPAPGARDVDWESLRAVAITFDRRINELSLGADTVDVATLWHGDLGPEIEVRGSTLVVRLTRQPIPDVGLRVTVTVRGGERGLKGMDGSPLLGDYALRFDTMPRLKPEIVLSQVVDDARDATQRHVRVLVKKPFAVRVAAGIPAESELTFERVDVTLLGPVQGEQQEQTVDFYPGLWPPTVPRDVAERGNTANFTFPEPPFAGRNVFRAELHPSRAPADKVFAVEAADVNANRFASARDTVKRVLVVPLINNLVPAYRWRTSRGQQQAWLAGVTAASADLLPTGYVAGALGYLQDSTCAGASGNHVDCRDAAPWTHFQYWVRRVGRAGMLTGWTHVMGLVPDGWLGTLTDHPDVIASPAMYHGMERSRVWSYRVRQDDGSIAAGAESSLIEVGAPFEALVHAIGDAEGLADSSAESDQLRGFDVRTGRIRYNDGTRSMGAYRSVMNLGYADAETWIAVPEYEALLHRWTTRCIGVPPCPPVPNAGGGGSGGRAASAVIASGSLAPAADAAEDPDPVPVVGVSGAMRTEGGRETGYLEPLIRAEGVPSADAADGDHAIELRAADGRVLARRRFVPAFADAGGGIRIASFLLSLPWDASAAAVVLVGPGGETAAIRRSSQAPAVAFVRPGPGERSRGTFEVSWRGSDADGDQLTYSLLAGADGASWRPIVVDTASTSLQLDSTLVPNGPRSILRVVASDGFLETEASLELHLDNPLAVLGAYPPDGARDVGTWTTVLAQLRDPLDPASVPGSLRVHDGLGLPVPATISYEPLDGSILLSLQAPLAAGRTYEAILSGIRSVDGRTLAAPHRWRFSTRGHAAWLPVVSRSHGAPAAAPTDWPTPRDAPPVSPTPPRTPYAPGTSATAPGTGTPTPTLPPSPGPTSTATASPSASATPSATDVPGPSPSPTDGPTATPPPGVSVVSVFVSGPDPSLRRTIFAPGETMLMWVRVASGESAAVAANFEFDVVGDGGYAPPELAWRGTLDVPPGATWFKLERTVPASAPHGAYTYLATVTRGADNTTGTSSVYLASRLLRADDFADPGSGWADGRSAEAEWGYDAGEYRIRLLADDWWVRVTPGTTATDLALEAHVRVSGGAGGSAALLFGLAGDDLGIFEVRPDGHFAVYRRVAGEWRAVVEATPSSALLTGEATNHLAVVRRSGELTLYANGQRIADVADLTGASGALGVYASAARAGVEARFDNWRAYDAAVQ